MGQKLPHMSPKVYPMMWDKSFPLLIGLEFSSYITNCLQVGLMFTDFVGQKLPNMDPKIYPIMWDKSFPILVGTDEKSNSLILRRTKVAQFTLSLILKIYISHFPNFLTP